MKYRFLLILSFGLTGVCYSQQNITVGEAVAAALQKNYDVKLQQNIAATANSDKKFAAIGVFLPNINGVGAIVKNTTDSRSITASDVETVRTGIKSTNTQGSVQLVWTLFDGTKMFATRKRLVETAELNELNVRSLMNNTVASVVNNYYNIVRQKQQLKAFQEQIGVGEERVKLAEKKLQVGTGGKPEFLQAKVDLNAFRTSALAQEALILQLKDQLNGLVGLTLPPTYETADTIIIDMDMTLQEVIANIEETNPTLIAARKAIEVAEAGVWESRAGRSPVVNFNSNYNFNKTENAVAASPVSLLYSRNKGLNYGLSVSLPILNGLNITNNINKARINLERQKLIYDQQVMVATVNARVAYAGYDNARKTLIIEEENILLAKENVFIMLESFKRGIATTIELRTAQQSLVDAYTRLIAARYNAKVSETELLRLRGALLVSQ
ncbi:MAG: TolC family protein [Cytophaga sp.]|nr:TolC family protein [Cytophaga sp.]